MDDARLARHFGAGYPPAGNVSVVQHRWDDAPSLIAVGTLREEDLAEISGGLLAEPVPIRVHHLALEADRILVVNPVFPHEVVGFSGGHKYFFPGIAGREILDASHWLGALITNPKVNGHKETPVRTLIERAAALVPTPRVGLSLVMRGHDPVGAFSGDVYEAWSAAADLSAETNVVWKERPFQTVLSVAPPMYRELWTAGKCMYKLEPVVADGGRLIIYAPHLREISPTHGGWIEKVGYHTRDYFLGQPERFRDVPRCVLAHSTHVKGIGTYVDGVERPRIKVDLATGLAPELCDRINLGYVDPASISPDDWTLRGEEDVLVVPTAGEMLYRLADGNVPEVNEPRRGN
jgi:nickel-dependent lactate racemase